MPLVPFALSGCLIILEYGQKGGLTISKQFVARENKAESHAFLTVLSYKG